MSSPPFGLMTTIVQAGAGTGKTQSLANRIIDSAIQIYESKKEVPKFVATTFTERATSELRERVVSLLAQRENAPSWLIDFVQDTENLHISTIHGTLSLFLHRYGSLIGLDPEFTILKVQEERSLLSKILRETISKEQKFGQLLDHYAFGDLVDLVLMLIPHRRTHGDRIKPALGWEMVIKGELVVLLKALENFKTIDSLELPEKSGEAIRVLQKLGSTLQEFLEKPTEARALFLEAIESVRRPSGKKMAEFREPLDVVFDLIRDNWKEPKYQAEINQRYDETAPLLQSLIVECTEKLIQDKREKGLMSFDDLEFISFELSKKHPEILKSWHNEWDFWFIDEFQDTSPLQKELLFNFLRNPWNAYFVGDPQQSIYLFRGADENVFQETMNLVAKQGGRLEKLDINYRSDPDLLRFLNLIFTNMKTPMGLLKGREEEKGQIRGIINLATRDVDEIDLILAQINQWLDQGVSFQDIAVLVTKNAKAKAIGKRLSEVGVPVYIHSTGGFYDRREILDALGLLSFIEDPSDDESFVLIARSPWIGIGDSDLAHWGTERRGLSFWEWLKTKPEIFEKYLNLKNLDLAIQKSESLPLSQVYSQALDSLGFWEFCLVEDSSGSREANLRKLLSSLKRAEERTNFSASQFIEEAWSEVLDNGEETEAASFVEPERVNVMTVHKSKGLKFNSVIVPYCGENFKEMDLPVEKAPDGRWSMRVLSPESEEKVGPLMHSQLKAERSQREFAESSRVFYVAITRAAERLSLIGKVELGKKSWFSQMSLPMTPGLHHQSYEVKIWNEKPTFKKIEETEKKTEALKLKFKSQPSIKVTQLNVTQLVQSQSSAKEVPLKIQLEAQQRGQAIHFIFEKLKVIEPGQLNSLCESATRLFALGQTIDPKIVSKSLNLGVPPLQKLILKGKTEWPFLIREKDLTLSGQIDLWGEVDGVTWIIDYKSSKNLNEENLKLAQAQLELYALAINKTGVPWNKIKTAVVAPFLGESVELKLRELKEVQELIATAATRTPPVNAR